MAQTEHRPVLVVGDSRWDVAWALQEAGIPAEQAVSGAHACERLAHGRLAGVVVEGSPEGVDLDALADTAQPDPDTGELPFILAVPHVKNPAEVVARVQSVLQTNWSSEPR